MNKLSTKKMLTVLISLAMVFSALAVLSLAAQPAYATASGSITLNPTTFGESGGHPVATVVTANGGTFGSGSTVYFYLSSTASSSGITISGYTSYIGSVALPGGSTTLSNTVVTLFSSAAALTAGSYYILASDSSTPTAVGAQFTTAVPITVVSTQPSISITSSPPFTVGQQVSFSGSGWDSGASVSVYLNYAGGTVLTSFTATLTGAVPANEFFVVPAVSGTVTATGGSYSPAIPALNVIAEETNALSGSFPQGGITADTTMNVAPSITVSPMSTQGAASSVFTITGSGFVAGQVIPGFTSISPGTSSITIASQNTFYSAVTVGADGSFTVTVTLATAIPSGNYASQGIDGQSVVVSPTGPSGSSTFNGVLYLSFPAPAVTPHLYIYPTSGSPGDPITFVVVGFPASTSVSIYFDSSVFTTTTDSNGFASLSAVIPAVQGGSYTIEAVGGGYSAAAAFSALSYTVSITDSSGLPLNGEYAAIGSVVTIDAQGLTPYEAITTLIDTGLGTTIYGANIFVANQTNGYPVTLLNGSIVPGTGFEANGLGIFTISYAIDYHLPTTGASETITIGSSTISPSVTATYYEVSKASVGAFGTSYAPLASVSLSIAYLIPTGSPITPETSKWIGPFSLTIDGTVIKLNTGFTTFTSPSGSAAVVFLLPSSVGDGVHTFVLQSASSYALFTNPEFIVSTPSGSSGTVVNSVADSMVVGGTGTIGNPFTGYPDLSSGTNNASYGAEFDLYNFPASASITVTVYSSGGSFTTPVTTDAHGGASVFVPFPLSTGNVPFLIQFSRASTTITGANWYYEDLPAVAFDISSFLDKGGMPATDYYSYFFSTAPAGSTVFFYANSLLPDTSYNVFLNTSSSFAPSDLQTSFVTGAHGDYADGVALTLSDYLTTGTYYIDVSPASSSATSTSLFLTVEVTQLGPAYAFPGQVVNVGPISVSAPTGTQFYQVTVTLNGSAFKTLNVPVVSGTISFSFKMPNGQPGNYWTVGYNYRPVIQTTSTIQNIAETTLTGGSSSPSSFSVTAFSPTPESGSATFSIGTTPSSITGLVLVPASGTTVSDVTINSWTFSSGTLTVYYTAVFSSTGLTAKISSATVTYTASASDSTTSISPGTYTQSTFPPTTETGSASFSIPSGETVTALNSFVLVPASGTTVLSTTVTSWTFSSPTLTVDYSAVVNSSTSTTAKISSALATYTVTETPSAATVFHPASYTVTANTSTPETGYVNFTVPSGLPPTAITSFTLAPGSNTALGAYAVTGWLYTGTTLTVYFSVTLKSSTTTATLASANVTYSSTVTSSLTPSPTTYTISAMPPTTEYGSASFTIASGTPTSITSLVLGPATGTTVTGVTINSWTFSSGTLTVYFTAVVSSTGLTATISSAAVTYSSTFSLTAATPSSGSPTTFTISAMPPTTEYGSAAFTTISGTPTSITSLVLSPATGTTVKGVTINSWTFSSGTLTVDFKAVVSSTGLTATISSATVAYSSTVTSSVTPSPASYAISAMPPTTEYGSAAFTIASGAPSPTSITSLVLSPATGTTVTGVTINSWTFSSGTLNVYFTAVVSSTGLTATISSATVTYDSSYNTAPSSGIAPSAGYTITTFGPQTVYGTVAVTSSNAPLTVQSLEFPSPLSGTTVTGVEINGWVYSGTTLTVAYSAVVSSTSTTATVGGGAVMITYLGTPTSVATDSYGTANTVLLPYHTTLVSGSGALLTGISPSQIATLTADVTGAVKTSMQVPLSDLNASVVAINGVVAKIDTAFGNMTATLSAINATVGSISSGQVLVLTKLGSVETSLASLNASLMMVNGNVATINTTLGMVQASLSSIGATVSSTATSVSGLVGSTATIKTDLGNISGQVTGVSNGVATIQTSIGKLNSSVSQIQLSAGQIKTSSNTLEIFLIVAIVLILITLVIAFLAVNNTNRLAKKFEEQKKQ